MLAGSSGLEVTDPPSAELHLLQGALTARRSHRPGRSPVPARPPGVGNACTEGWGDSEERGAHHTTPAFCHPCGHGNRSWLSHGRGASSWLRVWILTIARRWTQLSGWRAECLKRGQESCRLCSRFHPRSKEKSPQRGPHEPGGRTELSSACPSSPAWAITEYSVLE